MEIEAGDLFGRVRDTLTAMDDLDNYIPLNTQARTLLRRVVVPTARDAIRKCLNEGRYDYLVLITEICRSMIVTITNNEIFADKVRVSRDELEKCSAIWRSWR
jgi:hypothetical protein